MRELETRAEKPSAQLWKSRLLPWEVICSYFKGVKEGRAWLRMAPAARKGSAEASLLLRAGYELERPTLRAFLDPQSHSACTGDPEDPRAEPPPTCSGTVGAGMHLSQHATVVISLAFLIFHKIIGYIIAVSDERALGPWFWVQD